MVGQAILLWEVEDVDYALQRQQLRQGLLQKNRHCVERGLPHYSLVLVEVL
jgi:hypothetical protein